MTGILAGLVLGWFVRDLRAARQYRRMLAAQTALRAAWLDKLEEPQFRSVDALEVERFLREDLAHPWRPA